jgi:DNA-binding XRE family transcriptional regulator
MKPHNQSNAAAPRASAFACRLRELRAAAGLTQFALAKLADITPQTVYQLEADRCDPKWSTVVSLAAALGATPDDFTLR